LDPFYGNQSAFSVPFSKMREAYFFEKEVKESFENLLKIIPKNRYGYKALIVLKAID